MATGSQAAAFTPRTVARIERGASAIVDRFSMPVRAIGVRTLSLVDRLFGVRLLAAMEQPLYSRRTLSPSAMLFPIPWYASEPQRALRRPARPATQPAAAMSRLPAAAPSVPPVLGGPEPI